MIWFYTVCLLFFVVDFILTKIGINKVSKWRLMVYQFGIGLVCLSELLESLLA